MSYHERQSTSAGAPRQRHQASARQWASKPLTSAQKSSLAVLAKDAYAIQCRAGLCDMPPDDFRRLQVYIATGKNGLRECDNTHFRAIKAHFLRMAGRAAEADATWAKTGRVKGSDEIHDTHENRETARSVLRDLVRLSRGAISDAYIEEILADRFHGASLDDLRASQLQDLVFVITQRLRSKNRDTSL
jgi:hypothetical protein